MMQHECIELRLHWFELVPPSWTLWAQGRYVSQGEIRQNDFMWLPVNGSQLVRPFRPGDCCVLNGEIGQVESLLPVPDLALVQLFFSQSRLVVATDELEHA
jgi:hypothetical protein